MQDTLHKELSNPISVIGNAESIFEKEYGNLIDKNLTIRFNRADIINEKSQGTRWDYLVSSEVNTFEKYNTQTPKFHTLIFSPTKKSLTYKVKKIKFNTRIYHLPLFQAQELEKKLTAPPSTGLQILYFLDYLRNENVSIFGFDFKKTPTFYEKRNKGKHDYIKEKDLVISLIEKNNWNFYS
jgi:hypothetical protein